MAELNNSNRVISNQQGIHENLETIVRKHFETIYKKPIAEHTQNAFDMVKPRVEKALAKDTPLLFDSFCGTGMSTGILAEQRPDALVIGIDRSSARLDKTYNQSLPSNAVLIQAECADFWQLAVNAEWMLQQHTIYYPNPYPKAKHIKRRWHAHPAYPLLFSLRGTIELRTNWKIYADEFRQAFIYATDYLEDSKYYCDGVEILQLDASQLNQEDLAPCFMTLFEKKYFFNNQPLYRCRLMT